MSAIIVMGCNFLICTAFLIKSFQAIIYCKATVFKFQSDNCHCLGV